MYTDPTGHIYQNVNGVDVNFDPSVQEDQDYIRYVYKETAKTPNIKSSEYYYKNFKAIIPAYDLMMEYRDRSSNLELNINGYQNYDKYSKFFNSISQEQLLIGIQNNYEYLRLIQLALLDNPAIKGNKELSQKIFSDWYNGQIASSDIIGTYIDVLKNGSSGPIISAEENRRLGKKIVSSMVFACGMVPGLKERMEQENGDRDIVTGEPISGSRYAKEIGVSVLSFAIPGAFKLGGKAIKALRGTEVLAYESKILSEYSYLLNEGTGSIEFAGGAQVFVSDLSYVTGKASKARNKAIEAVIKENLSSLNLISTPVYSPFAIKGVAKQGNITTQIGKQVFSTRDDLIGTIVHEELHKRWWKKGIPSYHHSPDEYIKGEVFYKVIERYKRMRGFNYSQEILNQPTTKTLREIYSTVKN